LSRGIKENSIKEWRIGYAPDDWKGLSDFLISKGYKTEEIVKAGLGIKNEAGNYYDRFRGRIIFPIFDPNSQIIGFGGRIFGPKSKDEIAKYVNTPNTLLYDKSRVLYGLHSAKEEIRKNNSCILVEGYTDVIMVSQAGYKNVVATSGTALTPFQLRILKRYAENLLTAFDMDIAGDSATKRGIDLAQSLGFSIKVITMPEGSDPADIISKNLQEWEKLAQEAKSILAFYFDTTFSRFNSRDPEGKKEIGKILLPILKRIPNKIEQGFWVQELARKLEVKEENIEEELRKVKKAEPAFLGANSEDFDVKQISPQFWQEKRSRKDLLEEQIVISIFRSPESLEIITEKELSLFSSPICQILDCLRKSQPLVRQVSNEAGDFQFEVIKTNVPSDLVEFVNYLALKSEVEEMTPQELNEECKKCLKAIKILEIKNKLDEFSRGIKNAERENNLEKAQTFLDQFHLCSKSLRDLESA
jgi:DNA primase